METTNEINRIVEEYADTIKRICYSYTKNYHDTEDIMQNVFLKYFHHPPFDSSEHEKAWIIRITINCCKDTLKSMFRKHVPIDEAEEVIVESEDLGYVREAVRKLPEKYRNVIFLFYFEGYSAVEIAEILQKKENTIYTWMNRGRKLLEKSLGGDFFAE